jgi:hypothetical protein
MNAVSDNAVAYHLSSSECLQGEFDPGGSHTNSDAHNELDSNIHNLYHQESSW